MDEVVKKQCFRCEEVLPIGDFYKHKMMADGHLNKCKECTKADARAHRDSRLDYYQAYDRVRYAKHGHRGQASREAQLQGGRRWDERNKDKKKAHGAVNKSVRAGRLDRSDACHSCGASDRQLQAHHHDYSKPLDVHWLCTACHGKEHRKYDWDQDRKKVDREKLHAKMV